MNRAPVTGDPDRTLARRRGKGNTERSPAGLDPAPVAPGTTSRPRRTPAILAASLAVHDDTVTDVPPLRMLPARQPCFAYFGIPRPAPPRHTMASRPGSELARQDGPSRQPSRRRRGWHERPGRLTIMGRPLRSKPAVPTALPAPTRLPCVTDWSAEIADSVSRVWRERDGGHWPEVPPREGIVTR
jgi:hypothetical protein